MSGYIKCPCDIYEPGPDGICVDPECGHDGHQHNIEVGEHEACLAQESDEPGCYLPFEDSTTVTGSGARWSGTAEVSSPVVDGLGCPPHP